MTDDPTGFDPNSFRTDPSVNPAPERTKREARGIVCPACESTRVKTTEPTALRRDYRCCDCGAEFAENGDQFFVG